MPLTRGIAASRLVIEGASLQQVSPLLRGEILIGAAYLIVGYVIFRRFELLAKRKGTLEAA